VGSAIAYCTSLRPAMVMPGICRMPKSGQRSLLTTLPNLSTCAGISNTAAITKPSMSARALATASVALWCIDLMVSAHAVPLGNLSRSMSIICRRMGTAMTTPTKDTADIQKASCHQSSDVCVVM
jgi:hypothetical protein